MDTPLTPLLTGEFALFSTADMADATRRKYIISNYFVFCSATYTNYVFAIPLKTIKKYHKDHPDLADYNIFNDIASCRSEK